ncbi:MarR family transcriptional regulator [Pelatocladus sp. BLCC-F211]|uniref:MarR family transcriptional regulator n=1 Tax=Pelatocladus sp. BLCC-F211 TaxID=3342752 RepID=UPI0035BA1F2A
MTQNGVKIQGKFYPLQHEEWLRACRELTPAQRDVLYYIRTIDPYNQGIEINCAEIARLVSKPRRKLKKETVSHTIKELIALGFLSDEIAVTSLEVQP